MCYTTQGISHAFFAGDYGCCNTSYVRGTESHVHRDGGSRGLSHSLPYADDADWWF